MITSCYDDGGAFMLQEPDGDIHFFQNQVQNKTRTVSFVHNEGIAFSTEAHTIITIPPLAFVKEGVALSEDGIITLGYIELKTKADLVKYDLPTVTRNSLLNSAGVYKFTAYAGPDKLDLAQDKSINIKTPAFDPVAEMELFNWNEDDDTNFWVQTDGTDDQFDNVTAREFGWPNNIAFHAYEFGLNRLDWTNVDVFYDVPAEDKTTLCIDMSEGFSNENTLIFAVFDDQNIVVKLETGSDNDSFCNSFTNSLPIGANITLVGITSYSETTFSLGSKRITVTENSLETLPMEDSNIVEIETLLLTL